MMFARYTQGSDMLVSICIHIYIYVLSVQSPESCTYWWLVSNKGIQSLAWSAGLRIYGKGLGLGVYPPPSQYGNTV